jgi:cell division transport system permease protein
MSGQATRTTRKPAPVPVPVTATESRRPRTPWRSRLGAWRDQHFFSFFSSLGRLASRPWATSLTVLVLGFALALPLLFFLAFENARELSGGMRAAREVTVFLQPALGAREASAFAEELRRRDDVASVLVRTPEQGLAEFRQLSGFGEALDMLKDNPLPTVVVVTPLVADDLDNPGLVGELKSDARVDLVQYDAAWRRKLSGILDFGERIVVVTLSLLALASLLVIGNTVRMDIQSRSEEISVMQLIGASNGFVRRPFLYSGLWYGLLGGVLALVIVLTVEFALATPVERLLVTYGNGVSLRGIDLPTAAAVVAASMLLGWIGAHIATARHLAAGRPQR